MTPIDNGLTDFKEMACYDNKNHTMEMLLMRKKPSRYTIQKVIYNP